MTQQKDSRAADSNGQPTTEPIKVTSGAEFTEMDGAGEMMVPYGTRSRNKTASSRPNYAEDKDIENDSYDFYADKKNGDAKRPHRQTSAQGNSDAPRAANNSRKSDGNIAKLPPTSNGTHDQPTGSVLEASPAAQISNGGQTSRKRKVTTQQPQPNSDSTTTTRKSSDQLQDSQPLWKRSNLLTFDKCNARLNGGCLIADDGTRLAADDHVYLVCEPPGEPYYVGRIMEFLHAQNDSKRQIDAVRINWFYRPKDIGRKNNDTRLVYATMHSDISPLTALRGKCEIRHRSEIDSMDDYRRRPDSFWFEKLYDRYIQKNYDLIPTAAIVNVPEKVKKVLDERWKYVLVEQGRGKELTSAVKLCKRCSGYCASNDSVDCAVCRNTYHMNCVKPPLLKKPSRGFAWSCAACSRAQERKLEAQHTPVAGDRLLDVEEDEYIDEEEEDLHALDTNGTSPDPEHENHHQGTKEQIYQASLWPWRYLGMHCKPEDALDYDDRIYPRASTRIGPRHQASVGTWPGRSVEYEKPVEIKKVGKKDAKAAREAQAALEAEKLRRESRPKWVQDEPPGYVARGFDPDEISDSDATVDIVWKPPIEGITAPNGVKQYMAKAQTLAKKLNLPERSTNLQDVALGTLVTSNYDTASALAVLELTERKRFKEPRLSKKEQEAFADAISKYGSELGLVTRQVKTLSPGDVVRYYYTWKKTDKGREVWSNYSGRKGKKEAKKAEVEANRFADDVADADDDSAFDSEKATQKKRSFICQFCSKTSDRQWRRAPATTLGLIAKNGAKTSSKDKNTRYISALCRRCAELWRRYAVIWEPLDEITKKVAQAGGRAWRRKQDEELLRELQTAEESGFLSPERLSSPPAHSGSTGLSQEPPRKKLKGAPEKEQETTTPENGHVTVITLVKRKDKDKDKEKEKIKEQEQEKLEEKASSPPVPELPQPRELPCAICNQMKPDGDQRLTCRECRLTIHRGCYGTSSPRNTARWVCDTCVNDKNPQVSIHYQCVLCPVDHTDYELFEQPKMTHHKKKMTDKDREREKFEVRQARKATEQYRKRQEELARPPSPREPLKRTVGNNWVHITCAVWTQEVEFGNANALAPSEGIPSIPSSRFEVVCQVCNRAGGAVVLCQSHNCRKPYHVECARQSGHVLGFDVTPIKGSRRDQFNIVSINGETGTMSANLWCKDHVPQKTVIHQAHDPVAGTDLNALQFFVKNYKQADPTLTGTVRKANLSQLGTGPPTRMPGTIGSSLARRPSTTMVALPNSTNTTASAVIESSTAQLLNGDKSWDKVCITCVIDVSPKWWPIEPLYTSGGLDNIGSEAQKFLEQRSFQCHQCHKTNCLPMPRQVRPTTPLPAIDSTPFPGTLGINGTGAESRDQDLPPRDGSGLSARPFVQPTEHHPPARSDPVAAQVMEPVLAPPRQTASQLGSVWSQPGNLPSLHQPASGGVFTQWNTADNRHAPPLPTAGRNHHGGSPPRPSDPPLHHFSTLRPPSIVGGPPPGPTVPVNRLGPPTTPTSVPALTAASNLHQPLPPQPYVNGIVGGSYPQPPSQHQNNGPVPPAPFMAPYHGQTIHPPPPPPPSHGFGMIVPSAVPSHHTSSSIVQDGYTTPIAVQHRRPSFPSPHDSPIAAINGRPISQDSLRPFEAMPPRNNDSRPTSGASANPSLRNLLS